MQTKIAAALLSALMLSGCGYSAVENEAVGQAKKIAHMTPLVCMDYPGFDLSLGIMRNGTGSMSTQDMWFTVLPSVDLKALDAAVRAGSVVRVRYDTRRFAPCSYDHWMTGFEVLP